MYDRYKSWPLPGTPYVPHRDIEAQVLRDLAFVADGLNSEVEKIEILDSYAMYVRRAYQDDVAGALAQKASDFMATLLKPYIAGQVPIICAPHRGRRVAPAPAETQAEKQA